MVDNFERQLLGDAPRDQLPAVVRERIEKLRESMRREMNAGSGAGRPGKGASDG